MSNQEIVTVFGALGAMAAFLVMLVSTVLKIKRYLDEQTKTLHTMFSAELKEMRKVFRAELMRRDAAIRRLEYWAIKHSGHAGDKSPPFQPGVDPIEFKTADDQDNGV